MRKAAGIILACGLIVRAEHKQPKPVAPMPQVEAAAEVARGLQVSSRQIPTVNLRVWRETWIVFPDNEKIIQASNGDQANFPMNFVDAGRHLLEIKPALENRETNLHILTQTTKGDQSSYSFVLRETTKCATCRVDLKLFVEGGAGSMKTGPDPVEMAAQFQGRIDEAMAAAKRAKGEAVAAADSAQLAKREAAQRADREISAFKKDFPAANMCNYAFKQNKAPFEVGAICTDGTFTYVSSRGLGVQTIYAESPDGVSLVHFEYARGKSNRQGVYIINGVVAKGYLQAGKKNRLRFHAVADRAVEE